VFSAKAKVAMSRFEPGSSINYGKLHENINIVRRRSAAALHRNTGTESLLVPVSPMRDG